MDNNLEAYTSKIAMYHPLTMKIFQTGCNIVQKLQSIYSRIFFDVLRRGAVVHPRTDLEQMRRAYAIQQL